MRPSGNWDLNAAQTGENKTGGLNIVKMTVKFCHPTRREGANFVGIFAREEEAMVLHRKLGHWQKTGCWRLFADAKDGGETGIDSRRERRQMQIYGVPSATVQRETVPKRLAKA